MINFIDFAKKENKMLRNWLFKHLYTISFKEIISNYEVGSEITDSIKDIYGKFSEAPPVTFEVNLSC